ncbi:MAG: hypothetical protein HY719_15435 [Planctomycetes bacterium]|nr:hypothetical protein [Planctomycetota bacterium]
MARATLLFSLFAAFALALGLFCGCGSAEVVTWYIDQEAMFESVDYDHVQVMNNLEWEAYRGSPRNTGFRRIADIRADSLSDLRGFCGELGGDAVVEVTRHARSVPRKTAGITHFFWGSTYDLTTVEDIRGTAVRLNAAPPPRPEAP